MSKDSSPIIRHVQVNRYQTPERMLASTNRVKFTDQEVVGAMPRTGPEEVDVHFFELEHEEYAHPGWVTAEEIAQALERRHLQADPYAQGQANAENEEFADEYPNVGQWPGPDGGFCVIRFVRSHVGREVVVERANNGQKSGLWIAGVPK